MDIAALLDTPLRERPVEKRQDVLHFGDEPRIAHLLIAGHTCRYRMLRDGRRQITAILVPGDICDLQAAMSGRADYGVAALTHCRLGEIAVDQLLDGGSARPHLLPNLMRRLRRDEAIAREWMVSLGRRSAVESLAHLFCELRERLAAVGRVDGDSFEMRIGQSDLADALGISNVHVNRELKTLRNAGLVRLEGGLLTLLDRPALERLAHFDPTYLRH